MEQVFGLNRKFVGVNEDTSQKEGVNSSLVMMESLLDFLVKEDSKASKGDSKDRPKINILNKLFQNSGLSKDGISKAKGVINRYFAGQSVSLGDVEKYIFPVIRGYLLNNPDDHITVLQAFGPLIMKGGGNKVLNNLVSAHKDVVELSRGLTDKKTSAEALSQVHDVAGKLFGVSSKNANLVLENILPTLKSMEKQNPQKMESFLTLLMPLIQMSTLRSGNANISDDLTKNGLLESLYNLPLGDQNVVLNLLNVAFQDLSGNKPPKPQDVANAIKGYVTDRNTRKNIGNGISKLLGNYAKAGQKGGPNYHHIIGLSMLFMLQFQQAIMEAREDQDKLQLTISSAMMKSAEATQQKIVKEAQKADAAEKAANKRPWWMIFAAIAVAVVGAVVAFFTMGLGAAIVAGMIGVFMASPLFNLCVSSISKAVAGSLHDGYYQGEYNKEYREDYKKYIGKGMDVEDAKAQAKLDASQGAEQFATQKANAVGGIIAKIILFVAIVVVSFGVGGITAGAEEAADSAAEGAGALAEGAVEGAVGDATNMVEELSEESIEEGVESNSMFRWTSKGTGKLAASQGLNELVSSNFWMDVLTTNPNWAKKHQGLVMALDAILQITMSVISMYAGFSAFKARSTEGLLSGLNSMVSKGGYLLGTSLFLQAGTQGINTVMSSLQASYLADLSRYMKKLGSLEAELSRLTASAATMQETMKINDSGSSTINKSVSEAINACEKLSGAEWTSAEKILS